MFNERDVFRYSEKYGLREEVHFLAEEARMRIFLNNRGIVSLLCSPTDLDQLALGFLDNEGLICAESDYWEIEVRKHTNEIHVYAEEATDVQSRLIHGTFVSGCGQGTTFFQLGENLPLVKNKEKINIHKLLEDVKVFHKASLFENNTRGIHSAALLINNQLIIRKDVGRHNAVDKIAGFCLLSKTKSHDSVLFLTGRVSSEIILKGIKMQIPYIVSLSGVTSLAVEMAQKVGITLLGYVRGKTAVIYSHPEQIIS
jgi:FdhD protein